MNEQSELTNKNSKGLNSTFLKCLAKKMFYGASIGTAIIDGVGYGVVSLSESITIAQNFPAISPAKIGTHTYLLMLSIIPALSGAGIISVNIYENKRNILGKENPRQKVAINANDSIKEYLKDHPAALLVIGIGGVVDGIIFFSNLRYILNQFEIHMTDGPQLVVGVVAALSTSLQFLLLNAPSLINYIRKGYKIDDYTKGVSNPIKKVGLRALVNIPPLVSTLFIWLFGVVESYELGHYISKEFEPSDIADVLAWILAIALGSMYAVCHYLLFGMNYKKWIASGILRRRSDIKVVSEDGSLPTLSRCQVLQIKLLYVMAISFALSSGLISFGAMDEGAYAIAFDEPPPTSLSQDSHFEQYITMFPLGYKAAAFGFLTLFSVGEGYAVEGTDFIQLRMGKKKIEYYLKSDEQKPLELIEKTHSKALLGYYRWDELVSDTVVFASVGGIKFILEWFFIPDIVSASSISFTQAFISSLFLGLANTAIRLYQHLFYSKPDLEKEIALNNLKQTNFFKLSNEEQRACFNKYMNTKKEFQNEIISFDKEVKKTLKKYTENSEKIPLLEEGKKNYETVDEVGLNIDKQQERDNEDKNVNTIRTIAQKEPTANAKLTHDELIELAYLVKKAAKKQVAWAIFVLSCFGTFSAVCTYYLMEAILRSTQTGEDEDRLDTSQMASTIIGGLAIVMCYRVYGKIDAVTRQTVSFAKSTYSFFSGKKQGEMMHEKDMQIYDSDTTRLER